jgi:hypothetical protein
MGMTDSVLKPTSKNMVEYSESKTAGGNRIIATGITGVVDHV